MGDLLIRNLDPAIKERLLESARKSGRSLSDEAALRLKHSLVEPTLPRAPRAPAVVIFVAVSNPNQSMALVAAF